MLCKKCQIWADTIQVKTHQPPWQHCHHELEQLIELGEEDYPEKQGEDAREGWKRICDSMINVEKPKEKCWCENDVRMTKIWGQIGNIQKGWDIFFCPHCGRRL